MKLQINLYQANANIERGDKPFGTAIEYNCTSLIINGVQVIRNGELNTSLASLDQNSAQSVAEQLVPADLRYDPNALNRLGLDDQS